MERKCFHCGSTQGAFIEHDGKDFCCRGCSTVYDILHENKLYKYYEFEVNPGNRRDESSVSHFDYLDQPDIKKDLLDFSEGRMARVRFYIPSIHCSSCIWLLENLQRLNGGILNSVVNFTRKEVSITFDEELISLSELARLLESIHYKPLIREDKDDSKIRKDRSSKSLLIKLGIAGFAFGNVMLLSFPDYLSGTFSLRDHYIRYFGWVSMLLSLPVLFYAASDYFLSAWKNIRKKSVSIDLPIALGIATIFLRSTYEIVWGTGTGYFDSLTGLVFFLLIGRWYQDKTYAALNFESDYTAYFPLGITRKTATGEEIVPIRNLRIDDRIVVHHAEIIPADAVLDAPETLIDYSFITGESIPVKKERGDLIFAGGRQLGKSVELIVRKEVETSYLAQLWKEQHPQEEGTFISVTLDKVSKYFTVIIMLISAIAGLYWYFIDPSLAIIAFTSVLIVACPCALALSAPFTFGHAQRILGRVGFFLRHSSIVEKLADIDAVVFDKTGTLTDSRLYRVDTGFSLQVKENLQLAKSLVKHSFHPLSRAIYDSLPEINEIPVDSYEEIAGSGIQGRVGDKLVKIGSPDYVGGGALLNKDTASRVFLAIDNKVIGDFKLYSHYRENWQEAVRSIAQDYEFHLLSGDNDRELLTIVNATGSSENLNFNQSPRQKLEYIHKLTAQGRKTVMIGDGLNDAGALKTSTVGISVAEDIYQFSPASDAIIHASALGRLHRIFRFARSTRWIVWISIGFSFLYNVVGIWYAASARLSPLFAAVLMPLSSVTVVILATLLTQNAGKRERLNNIPSVG